MGIKVNLPQFSNNSEQVFASKRVRQRISKVNRGLDYVKSLQPKIARVEQYITQKDYSALRPY